MFIGRINAKLDAKGRVFVPANYRKILAGNETLVGRMDAANNYLVVYTEEVWEQKFNSLQSRLDEWNSKDNDRLMQFFEGAVELSIDSQGRLLVPKIQKGKMNVNAELTFVGMGDRFAIWDKDVYDEYCKGREPFSVPAK